MKLGQEASVHGLLIRFKLENQLQKQVLQLYLRTDVTLAEVKALLHM